LQFVELSRRRKLKNAVIRSRIPFKGVLARGYLRAVERFRSMGGGGRRRSEPGGLALPSSRLRVLVVGTADVDWFLDTGKAQSDYLRDLLAGIGRPMDGMDAILDFGCGCGRIARWFADLSGPQINACDYNGELVTWCAENLSFVRARKTELYPPLRYPEGSFDFLYAFSVFTHLTVELAGRWLAELRRVVRPGGLMWFTIHGDSYRERLLPEQKQRFDAGEIVVWLPEIVGTNLCASYWPKSAVEKMLGPDYEVLVHLDPTADSELARKVFLEHDAYLVRRL
jgi:SAM-dependent methyltransferase